MPTGEGPDAPSAWRRMGPIPGVWPSHRNKGFGADALKDRYAALGKEALVVRARLATPYIPALPSGALHLDGILAAMVVESHPCPMRFPEREDESAVLPVPLEAAWVSPEGRPLWTASLMLPEGEFHRSREYWHKRYPEDRAVLSTKIGANTRAGRNKEYRVPVQTVLADTLVALVVGNREEVERLLSYCSSIGKRTGSGYGRVAAWEVEPVEGLEVGQAREAALRGRELPLRYLGGSHEMGNIVRLEPIFGLNKRFLCLPKRRWAGEIHDRWSRPSNS